MACPHVICYLVTDLKVFEVISYFEFAVNKSKEDKNQFA